MIGDAAQIRASAVRPQKTDKRDAALLLQLLIEVASSDLAGVSRRIRQGRGAFVQKTFVTH